jgi:hypothetical protein
MNTTPKISKVSDRIPKFVRDYLNLKDSDEFNGIKALKAM